MRDAEDVREELLVNAAPEIVALAEAVEKWRRAGVSVPGGFAALDALNATVGHGGS